MLHNNARGTLVVQGDVHYMPQTYGQGGGSSAAGLDGHVWPASRLATNDQVSIS